MLKALLWKEWREQRAVVLAGVCLSLFLPLVVRSSLVAVGAGADALLFSQIVAVGTALFAWPLFASLTAAAAHAEHGPAQAGYLLSKPISRASVWSAKIVAAFAGLTTVVAFSFVFAQLVHRWYLGIWIDFPFVPGSFSVFALSPASMAAIVVGSTLLVFACTTFFASKTRSQLVAAALGVVAALAFVYVGFFFQAAVAAQPAISGGSGAFMLAFLGASASGVLLAAFLLFGVGIDVDNRAYRRLAMSAVAIFMALFATGAAAGVVMATRIDPSQAGRIVIADVVPGRSQALIEVNAGPFKGQSFWLAGPGRPPRQLTRRLSDEASVVPGGEWVVYKTHGGDWGLRRDACMMRRVALDGSADELVLDVVPCHAERLFSADGTRVALRVSRSTLRVISLDGTAPPINIGHGLPEAERDELEPVRWVNDDRHILMVGIKSIRLLDVATGAMSELLRNPARIGRNGSINYSGWSIVTTSSHLLMTGLYSGVRPVAPSSRPPRDDADARLRVRRLVIMLVELASGDARELADPCAGLRSTNLHFAGRGETFWAICDSGSVGEGTSTISVLRPGESEMSVLATLTGSVGGGFYPWRTPRSGRPLYFLPSPSGEHLIVTHSRPHGDDGHDRILHYFIIDRDGDMREIEGLTYVPVRMRSAGGELTPPDADPRPWGIDRWLDEQTLAVSRGGPGPWYTWPFTELGYIDASMTAPAVFLRIGEPS